MQNATVREILVRLCTLDPRYEFQIIERKLINIRPRDSYRIQPDLPAIKIRDFSVHGNVAPFGLLGRIREFAPELNAFLRAKESDFDKLHGARPRGYPGAVLRGNMDPEIHIELHNLTVRQILNRIVLYSLKLYQERPPDKHGWRIPPTSWMYEFVVDPRAQTGLGGFPKWSSLD